MDIVKADSQQQLLLAVPHIAGSRIAHSIVLVPFHGRRNGMTARVGIPDALSKRAMAAWARTVLESLEQVRPDAVAIIVIADESIGAGSLPHQSLVRALRHRAAAIRVPVRACLIQAADAWGDYDEPGGAKGPIAELEVADGLPFVEPCRPPSLPAPASAEQRRAVIEHIDVLDRAHLEHLERVRDGADLRLEDVPQLTKAGLQTPLLLESALHQPVLGLETAALLIRVLQAPPMRDVATSQWLDGLAAGVRAHDEAAAYALGGSLADCGGADRLMGKGAAPDPARLERAVGLVERLVALAPEAMHPALLTILGSLHWFVGRAGTGERCVLRALEIVPGYGMATLVAQMIQAGLLPEWIDADRNARTSAAHA